MSHHILELLRTRWCITGTGPWQRCCCWRARVCPCRVRPFCCWRASWLIPSTSCGCPGSLWSGPWRRRWAESSDLHWGAHGGRPLIERYRDVFSIRAGDGGARGAVCSNATGRSHGFSCAIHLRNASAGRAAGGRAPDAVEEVRPVQLSGSRGLGDRDLRRGIHVWGTLGPTGPRSSARRFSGCDCDCGGHRGAVVAEPEGGE
jgi:hypothetical protein